MVMTRVYIIPFQRVLAMEQHARLARPASPEHSCASLLSGAHISRQQLVMQQQSPACMKQFIMFPKNVAHLEYRTSVGSSFNPRSCRKTCRLTSNAQQELHMPAKTHTSKHRNRFGQSCSP